MHTIIDAPKGVPPLVKWGRGTKVVKPKELKIISGLRQTFGADHTAPLVEVSQGQLIEVTQQVFIKQTGLARAHLSKNKIGVWGLDWRRGGRGYGCKKGRIDCQAGSLRFILRKKKGVWVLSAYPYHMGVWRKRCGDARPLIKQEVPIGEWFTLRYQVIWNTLSNYNGKLAVWLDGKPIEVRKEMRWYRHGQINQRVTLRLWSNSWRLGWIWTARAVLRIKGLLVKVSE